MAGLNLPPATFGSSQAAPETSSNALMRGEDIDVYVLEDESFSGRYTIRESGDIIIPRIGRIPLQGKTPAQAERIIQERLQRDQLKTASVLLERTRAMEPAHLGLTPDGQVVVYVTGSVLRPGRAALPDISSHPPTILQAISEAGGFARFADQRKVILLRRSEGGKTLRTILDVRKIQGGTAPDVPLTGGDVIIVQEKTFGF